nr:hypothetical protein [Tanacetum cinerariifolium]
KHTQDVLVAHLVPTLVVQLLRVLIDSTELSTLVVRFVHFLDRTKPPGFLSACVLSLLPPISHRGPSASSGEESLEIPNQRKRECGIRLILDPKSANVFFTVKGPIRHSRVKLPGSPSFWGKHTQDVLVAHLVPTLVVQLLRVLIDSTELSTLVVRFVHFLDRTKPPGFLSACVLSLLPPISHRGPSASSGEERSSQDD